MKITRIVALATLGFCLGCGKPGSSPAPPPTQDSKGTVPGSSPAKSAPANAASAVPGAATWEDAAGDVKPFSNKPNLPRLDLVGASAVSRGSDLVLMVTTKAGRLKDFLGYADAMGNKGGEVIAEFFLDTDNDAATGDSPSWSEEASRPLKGYDYQATVLLGFKYRNKESGATGSLFGNASANVVTNEVLGDFATYNLKRMKAGSGTEFVKRDPNDSSKKFEELCRLDGDTVEIRIPQSLIGVKPGGTVRLCFKESAEGAASGKGFSEDRLLSVK
jgi:hypothetical protein